MSAHWYRYYFIYLWTNGNVIIILMLSEYCWRYLTVSRSELIISQALWCGLCWLISSLPVDRAIIPDGSVFSFTCKLVSIQSGDKECLIKNIVVSTESLSLAGHKIIKQGGILITSQGIKEISIVIIAPRFLMKVK